MKTACFIYSDNKKYDKLQECAVNSFKKFHPKLKYGIILKDLDVKLMKYLKRMLTLGLMKVSTKKQKIFSQINVTAAIFSNKNLRYDYFSNRRIKYGWQTFTKSIAKSYLFK